MDMEFDGLNKSDSRGIETMGGIKQVLILNMNIHDIYRGVLFNDHPDLLVRQWLS